MRIIILFLLISFSLPTNTFSQKKKKQNASSKEENLYQALAWRNIGPFRGGRTNAVTGVKGNPLLYYFGGVGGGIFKTEDAGISWKNISDGFFKKSASVGAIEIAPSDPNVIYVGMGEHAIRGVMTSHGDGMYKSTDAGQTWKHIGLPNSRHIGAIVIHPSNADIVYVGVQGAPYGTGKDRGIYKTIDGGKTWQQVHFVNNTTGCADLTMDANNPRILYAGMWDYQRKPWQIRSGGAGSGIYKSTDSGATWTRLEGGLPKEMGKVAVDVSPSNSNRLYANIEAEKGGVYRSDDGGKSWQQTYDHRVSVARAWYYMEVFADPVDANRVYVLNAPMLRSIDGGKSFDRIPNPHTDQHDLWINPDNPQNMILGNDGGACITFNGGQSWSSQNNQPTAQFYRVITDNQFPYRVYGGQQDNSTVSIASRTRGGGIGTSDWHPVSGGESAFIAFDPDNPALVYGNSIQGFTDKWDRKTKNVKDIMAYPEVILGRNAEDMKYRFNWNNPLVAQPQNPKILYHGAQLVLKSSDGGQSWTEISKDLTRNQKEKQGDGSVPFTNEGAGGEVYNTISYLQCSPHKAGVIWVGTDDGLVQVTQDEGATWQNVTPKGLPESLINAIEVSPHNAATAYIAVTRYKFNDLSPMIYKTDNFGKSWKKIVNGIPADNFVRVVREDPKVKGLLYAGTEQGMYISTDDGRQWKPFQNNLPVTPITDLTIRDNDLVAATAGRGFWILDDLSAVQQSLGQKLDKAHLFQPKTTIKYTLGAPPTAPSGMGQNPMNGVILDYFLPENWQDTFELKLEILDASNQLIRTYSNQKNEDFKTWEGGPPPSPVLPAKIGANRFAWDLRKENLPAIDNVFLFGDYRGSTVAPDLYLIRLTANGEISEQKVEVKAEPNINIKASDYQEQQAMMDEIETTLRDIHQSVKQIRVVKTQLDAKIGLLKKMDVPTDLLEKGEAALKVFKTWEEKLIQPKQQTFQDVINFRNKLNAELLRVRAVLDNPDPRVTQGAKDVLSGNLKEWQTWKKEYNRILKEEIGTFNKAYHTAKLPALIVPDRME